MAEPARIDDSRTAATAVEQELCQQMVDMHLGAVGRGAKAADEPRAAPRCWPALHSPGVQIRVPSATARRVLTEGVTQAEGRRRVVVLILDFSGSMDGYKAMLRKAASDIVESAVTSGTESSLVVIKFATSACVVNEDNEEGVEELIGGSTNYTAGFRVAAAELRNRGVAPADATVIFMTDGEPDRGSGSVSAEDVPALRDCTFVPVLFSPHGKSNETLVARLHGICTILSTTPSSREHFVLHTLKTADGTNAADTMLSTLQIARGVLARFVYLRAMGERAPLTLGSDAVDAVAFLPLDEERVAAARADGFVDATIEMEGATHVPLRLAFQESADQEEQHNPTAGLLLELEALVEQTSRVTASGSSAASTTSAASAAAAAANATSTRSLLATCRHLREALHNNTDGAVVLLRGAIVKFEATVAAHALAPDALRAALSASAHPALQASLQNLRSLTTNVARAAALANTASGLVLASRSTSAAVRGSQLRGAAARLQSMVASSTADAERSLRVIYSTLSSELKSGAQVSLPSYLTEDVLLNDVSQNDAPAVVLITPGCALGAVVGKVTSDAVTPTERDLAAAREALGRAMNHGDASRVAFPFGGGVLTRESMVHLQRSGARLLPGGNAKLVFFAPTQGAMKQQAAVLTGLILLGEPIAMSGKFHEALLGVASAMLTQTEELENPIALATLAFAARAFLGAHTPSNNTQHFNTLGVIESRTTFHTTAGPITSLRTAATAHAIGAARFTMHHFVEELVRKRVQQLARRQPARLGAELERLMDATGVWTDGRERAQRQLNAVATLQQASDMLGSKVQVLYPRAVNPSSFVHWLVNLMHDEAGEDAPRTARQQHATHWEECPSWETFARMMRRAFAMSISGAELLNNSNATRGWITDDALQRLRSVLLNDAFPQQDDVALIADLLGGERNAARATVHAMYALLQRPKQCPDSLESFFAGTALLENSCITMPLLRTGVGRERETTPAVTVARLMRGAALDQQTLDEGDAAVLQRSFTHLLRAATSAHERMKIADVLRTRAAMLVTPDSELQTLLQEMGVWESFQFPERVERGFDPMKPTRKDFHRRLMGVCSKLGMNEPRTYTRAEVRARLVRANDARHTLTDAHWLTFAEDGVTLARNGRHTNSALRIDRVAGVARTPSAPAAASATAVDSVRALDKDALVAVYRAMHQA